MGLIYLLKRTELAVRSCVEVALAEFDLTPTQFLTLLRLTEGDSLSAAALARELGVRAQSIIEILGPLERKRLLRRRPSREHRRILQISLTASGRRLLAEAVRVAARLESELLGSSGDEALTVTQEVLRRLWQAAANHQLHPSSIRATAEQLRRAHLAVRRRRSLRVPRGVVTS
jgi:DNA-binding MarR family transcriptional regulator